MSDEVRPGADPTVTQPRRPTSLNPLELGFTPRRPVPWLGPLLLLSTGLRTVFAMLFGAYLDKRELQNALPSEINTVDGRDGELWLDYVADIGDGFHATYSVAYLIGKERLDVDGHRLPRADMLVMGGDQVYPTASGEAYEDRCKGPYTAALPTAPEHGPQPVLYALPGNHDWYDGLTAFLRLFAKNKTDNLGGWRLDQARSYFAVRLPHRWWLFGIDEQNGAYLDHPQLKYFEEAAAQLGPDDRVILVTPAPTWVKADEDPKAYEAVDYFVRRIIGPTGARVPLLLSGDLHHYARYDGPGRSLVTCGGGGAYLVATHKLPERISVPPKATKVRKASTSLEYDLTATYPTRAASRRYGWGVFGRLPARNPGFVALLGALQTLLMLPMATTAERVSLPEQRLVSIPLSVMLLVVLLGAIFFAKPPTDDSARGTKHWLLGILHGAAQVCLAAAGALLWLELPFHDWPWPLPIAAAIAVYGPVSGLVAAEVTAAYLLIAGSFGVNVNELFAGQGIEGAKSFLRLHIDRRGRLTLYPVTLDRISREWRPNPQASPESAWLEPVIPLRPRLAEPPVSIDPRQP